MKINRNVSLLALMVISPVCMYGMDEAGARGYEKTPARSWGGFALDYSVRPVYNWTVQPISDLFNKRENPERELYKKSLAAMTLKRELAVAEHMPEFDTQDDEKTFDFTPQYSAMRTLRYRNGTVSATVLSIASWLGLGATFFIKNPDVDMRKVQIGLAGLALGATTGALTSKYLDNKNWKMSDDVVKKAISEEQGKLNLGRVTVKVADLEIKNRTAAKKISDMVVQAGGSWRKGKSADDSDNK